MNVLLGKQLSRENALVDAVLVFIGSFGDRVESFQKSDVVGFSVVKVDGQVGNSTLGSTLRNPGEGWGKAVPGSKAFLAKFSKI